jgi:hypothetical protein
LLLNIGGIIVTWDKRNTRWRNLFTCHHKFYMDWFWLNPEIQSERPVNNHLIAVMALKPDALKL